MENISILSMVISTLIPMILGFIYYHKAVMGKAWMDSLGFKEDDLQAGNMGVIFGVSLFLSFLLTFFIFANVNGPGQEGAFDTFKHGALHGAVMGFLVAVPVLVTNGLFEQKKWKNLAINSVYWIIAITLMGGVLDAMNTIPDSFFQH